MKNRFVFILLFLCLGLTACSKSGENNITTAPTPPMETENAANTPTETTGPATAEPTQKPTPTPEPTLSPADSMRKQLDAISGLNVKLDVASDLYEKDPEACLPVVRELLDGIDYSTLTTPIINFDRLLIDLYNNGETSLASDTLLKLLNALPVTPFDLDEMLGNAGTYLITAESELRYGHFEDGISADYIDTIWRTVLYQGFAVYMAQFHTLNDELAAAKNLAEHVFTYLPERASTDQLWPYKYDATAPGDGRWWDAKRDFSAQMPQLSTTRAQPPENKKALVVFRNDRDGDIEDWYIDLSFMPTLPTGFVPGSVSEANVLVTVDTVWKHDSDYMGGIKGYAATTTITAYDFQSGKLLKKLSEVDTPLPFTISISKDDKPEKYFASVVDDSQKLAIMGALINDYLEGK